MFLVLGTLAATPDTPAPLSPDDRKAILAKTAEVRLAPDLSRLSDDERDAVQLLIEAGQIMQSLYEQSRHPQTAEVRRRIAQLRRTAGHDAEARGQRLEQHRHEVAHQQHPHELVAEARAAGEIGGPVAGVHVADTHQVGGPCESEHPA